MQHVYGLFGFEFRLELSTRPENYLGTIETWNAAEDVRISRYVRQTLIRIHFYLATQTSSRSTILRQMGP
jgi:threonyl-tRNA synthetase